MEALKQAGLFLDTRLGLGLVLAGLAALMAVLALRLSSGRGRRCRGTILAAAAILYGSLVFLVISLGFRKQGEVSAAVVPRLWIAGLVACIVFLLLRVARGREEADQTGGRLSLVLLFIGLTSGCLAAIQLIGFFPSTLIYLIAGMLILAQRRWAVMLAVTAGWIAFVYFAFYRLLFVPLPEGALLRLLLG